MLFQKQAQVRLYLDFQKTFLLNSNKDIHENIYLKKSYEKIVLKGPKMSKSLAIWVFFTKNSIIFARFVPFKFLYRVTKPVGLS